MTSNFIEISEEELREIDGGGWKAAAMAIVGSIAVASTPVLFVVGGPGVSGAVFGAGCSALDWACDNKNK